MAVFLLSALWGFAFGATEPWGTVSHGWDGGSVPLMWNFEPTPSFLGLNPFRSGSTRAVSESTISIVHRTDSAMGFE